MKKISLLFLMACTGNSFGQWTDGNKIANFTLNDVKGNSHNLYSVLDSGKVVLLDFFFPACAPCWDGMVQHKLKDVVAEYGKNGSNQLRTFGLNIWGTVNSGNVAIPNINGVDITNQNFVRGDFEYTTNYPILPLGAAFGDSAKVQYAPTYMLVCPDKKAYESYYYNLETDALSKCNVSLTKAPNNVRIYVPELSTCSGFDRINIYGHLRNTGSNNITSARVKLMVNNTLLDTQNLTYSGTNNTSSTMGLTEFKFDNVLINQPLNTYGKGPYKIVVDMINGTNLATPIEKIIKIKTTNATTSSPNINIELKTDASSAQTSWFIYNSTGAIVAQNPGLTNNTTTNTAITMSGDGCYTVRLKDSGGDGSNNGDYLKVKTSSNTVLGNLNYGSFDYENFGYDVFYSFKVNATSSISDLSTVTNKVTIYPNPTTDKFRLETSEKVCVDIVDLLGKTVRTVKDVDNTRWIDISDLKTGCYLAKITNTQSSQLIKIIKE